MFIKTKLTEKDYVNATFVILFSRKTTRIFVVIFCLIAFPGSIINIAIGKPDFSLLISPLIVLVILPSLLYFTTKRSFSNNPRVNETIEYQFEPEMLVIKGESFSSQLTWNKIPKVILTKNWLLIWQNRQIANAIPRRDVWDGEINELKGILSKHNVKNNLP